MAAGWPLGLGCVRPVRPGDSGPTRDPAALPGAPAVGGTPGSVPAEERAQQPRPAVLRWAQPARAGAGREEGADPLQEVGGAEGHEGGQGNARSRCLAPQLDLQPLLAPPHPLHPQELYRGSWGRRGLPSKTEGGKERTLQGQDGTARRPESKLAPSRHC